VLLEVLRLSRSLGDSSYPLLGLPHNHPLALCILPGWAGPQAGSAVPDLGRPHDIVILELLCGEHLGGIVESHLQMRDSSSCRGIGQCHDQRTLRVLEFALQFRCCHPESSGQGRNLVYEG